MARLLGCLLVLGTALVALPGASVGSAVLLGLLLAAYLAAFLYARTHISAVAMGFAAALLWLDLVVVFPPVPSSLVLGVVFAAAGALGTAWITHRSALALHTAATASLCITGFAWLLLTRAPARFLSDPLPRNMISDPYLWLLLIGAVLSVALVALTAASRRAASPAIREHVTVGQR